MMTSIAEFSMLLWLLGFWRMFALLLGWDRPPEEQARLTSEERVAGATPAVGGVAVEPAPSVRDLGFDTVLPGLRGRVAVPAGPGRTTILTLKAVRVSDVFGAFRYMAEARDQWPFEAEAGSFAGYVALEGPRFELTIYFPEAGERVEYFIEKVGGTASVSGEVRWDVLAEALLLSPDYEAVVGYLALSPYRTAYYVA